MFGQIIDVKQICTTGSAVKYGPSKIYWNIDKTGWVNDECREKSINKILGGYWTEETEAMLVSWMRRNK